MKSHSSDRAIEAAPAAPPSDQMAFSLTGLMRARTRALHALAERSGIVNEVLRGKVSRYGSALLLRNLLPAYAQLEAGLEAHRHSPAVRMAARHELYRASALRSDLCALYGRAWETALPLLPSGREYSQRIAAAAEGNGHRLIAHAYTRYFGDLSGGQVLKRILARTSGLCPKELLFFDFPKISNLEAFKQLYKRSLDDSASEIADIAIVTEEAATAFLLNIAVSEDVQLAAHIAA